VRIARFSHDGRVGIGRVEGDEVVVLDAPDVLAGRSAPPTGDRLAVREVRLLAPVPRPPKFLGIGFNYRSHLTETGREEPDFPVFFNKQSTCVTGPFDPIVLPGVSDMVDWEGELGVVIGREARGLTPGDAPGVVAGYLVVNDVSTRDWQVRSPTMTLGKSFDTHGPLGPWLVTPDEVADPHELGLRTWLNGELVQDARTDEMVFDVWAQIATLSQACTLEPGDVITTGTPAGVGVARTPPRFLQPGDVVRVEVERVGTIENRVIRRVLGR
jgi:2-keto-4-pentenoate hydratase/2-oxohepta-3-ene-1,7-dioic acid hydratase in catechol pathway